MEVSPSGLSAAVTSTCVAPTVEGTTARDPGPTKTYQPTMPTTTAMTSAIFRFRRTRLLAFLRFRTSSVVSRGAGLAGIACVISFTFARSDLREGLGRIGSMGISSSRLS